MNRFGGALQRSTQQYISQKLKSHTFSRLGHSTSNGFISIFLSRLTHSSSNGSDRDDSLNSNRDKITINDTERKDKDEKLRALLNDFGVSLTKVRDGSTRKPRLARKRIFRNKKLVPIVLGKTPSSSSSSLQSNIPDDRNENYYEDDNTIFNNPLRVAEEFDLYHNIGSFRRRRRSGGRYDNIHITARLRVRSVHAAQTIDVTTALTKVFGMDSQFSAVRHMFGRTNLIVQLPPVIKVDEEKLQKADQTQSSETTFFDQATPRFVSLFRYGSIVFFNVSPKEAGQILEAVKLHSIDPVARGFERKEAYEVAISPTLDPNGSTVNGDFATVQELDINNVAVISTVMAQTVAFDSYNDTVDEMLAKFASINGKVKKTGNFTQMERETLFKIVAQNNSLFIDMLAKLGIKDRSDTAWNLSQYESIYDGMRSEFEIESRFENLEFKLNMIQQVRYFYVMIDHSYIQLFIEEVANNKNLCNHIF